MMDGGETRTVTTEAHAEHISVALRKRLTQFALRTIGYTGSLPKSGEAQVLAKRLVRSGTSVGAHYREACRSRSTAEFVSKIEVAIQELDETDYWLELLTESQLADPAQTRDLRAEAGELIAILVSSVKTAKRNSNR